MGNCVLKDTSIENNKLIKTEIIGINFSKEDMKNDSQKPKWY